MEGTEDSKRVGRVESVESAEVSNDLEASNLWRVQKIRKELEELICGEWR